MEAPSYNLTEVATQLNLLPDYILYLICFSDQNKLTISRESFQAETRFTYPVQTIDGHSFEGSSHHRIFLQHLVEVVN